MCHTFCHQVRRLQSICFHRCGTSRMAIPTLVCKMPPINSNPILSKPLSCIRAGCKFMTTSWALELPLLARPMLEDVVNDMNTVFLGWLACHVRYWKCVWSLNSNAPHHGQLILLHVDGCHLLHRCETSILLFRSLYGEPLLYIIKLTIQDSQWNQWETSKAPHTCTYRPLSNMNTNTVKCSNTCHTSHMLL